MLKDVSKTTSIPAPREYYSLATKLRWSYLLSSTLPLLIVGTILLYLSLDSQERSIYTLQHNRTQRIAGDIHTYVSRQRIALDMYAEQISLANLDHQQLNAQKFLEYRPDELIRLALFDQRGQERLHATQSQKLTQQHIPTDSLAVEKALHFGTITYGEIRPSEASKYSFLLTIPVRDQSQAVIAALQAEIDANPIADALGTVDQETLRRTLLIQADSALVMLPAGEASIPAQDLLQMRQYANFISRYNRSDGVGVVGSQAPVMIGSQDEHSGWMVVVDQPVSTAFGSTWNTALLLALFVVFATLFSLFLAYKQSRQLLKPLTILHDSATALGSGYLNYRSEYDEHNEFGDVVRAFNHMANQIQNSRNKIAQQNAHLRQGLILARDIQLGLLPKNTPWGEDVMEVQAYSMPAFEVGGDFYSYAELSEGGVAVGIGDISGKGVGAALMMALVSSSLEAQRRNTNNPAQTLSALNTQLLPRLQANHMNAALLLMIFDPDQSLVRIANAGMIAPILISEQGSQLLDIGGLPLGAYDKAIYQEQELFLQPGDILVFVSDGIVEALSPSGEMFGFERLENLINIANTDSLQSLVQLIMEAVFTHIGEAEPHDDMTIVAVRPKVYSLRTVVDKEQAVDYATI